jgi:DNA-directed RNA polymerase subunit M/transcription elongation factor TFIIS
MAMRFCERCGDMLVPDASRDYVRHDDGSIHVYCMTCGYEVTRLVRLEKSRYEWRKDNLY